MKVENIVMNVKLFLYIIIIPLCIWVIEALNLERFFRRNRMLQIITFYVVLSLGLSYLIVNFFYDFYQVTTSL